MKKSVLLSVLTFITMISCSTFVDEEITGATILKAEATRNSTSLVEISSLIKKNCVKEGQWAAIAAGRIPSFESWQALAETFVDNPSVTDKLAISARFPKTEFDKETVFQALKTFTQTAEVIETYLHLNHKPAFDEALLSEEHGDTVAFNLWRSKDLVSREIALKYYESNKNASVYSIYRGNATQAFDGTGIVLAEDLKSMDLATRVYGTLVCDKPEEMAADNDWQVRVTAVRAANNADVAKNLLTDPNPMVRQSAIDIYLKNEGDVRDIDLDSLEPVQAEIIAMDDKGKNVVLERIYAKGGLFSELSAPYFSKTRKDFIMGEDIPVKARILYLENIEEIENALELAKNAFMDESDLFSLIYLLETKEDIDKTDIIQKAIERGGQFLSILEDYQWVREQYKLPVHDQKEYPLGHYVNILRKIKAVKGFEIITEKGNITCHFIHDQAPLTCLNTINLIQKGYYKDLAFHRIVPSFVAQDGDPTGTGAGGPGYAIKCEYNELRYDKKGMVGMALAGKDTGGSQYFLIHQATPHLNHNYTIFAEMVNGGDVLDSLVRYDRIKELKLIGDVQPTAVEEHH